MISNCLTLADMLLIMNNMPEIYLVLVYLERNKVTMTFDLTGLSLRKQKQWTLMQ